MTRREFLVEVGGLVELPKLNGKSFAEVVIMMPKDAELDDKRSSTASAEWILVESFTWHKQGELLGVHDQQAFDYFNECSGLLANTTYMYFCSNLTNGPTLKAASEQGQC